MGISFQPISKTDSNIQVETKGPVFAYRLESKITAIGYNIIHNTLLRRKGICSSGTCSITSSVDTAISYKLV